MDTLGSSVFYTQAVQVPQSNINGSLQVLSLKKTQAPKRKQKIASIWHHGRVNNIAFRPSQGITLI